MAHRSFGNSTRPAPVEGPTFDLGDETFHCIPKPSVAHMASLTSAVNLVDWIEDILVREVPVESDVAGPPVFQPTDDVDRWRALATDETRLIGIDEITDVVLWLRDEYSGGRPTPRSRRS